MDLTALSGKLEGRVAVITGGSSGLGRAGALRFAAEGAKIMIGALQPDQGAAVVKEITAFGGDAVYVDTDVRGPPRWRRWSRRPRSAGAR